ncbi:hypothetical protein ONR57_09525, partial [Hoyosella sp. YIM 151337]|nr:hypothetical protein [Hoyosella sp. YIM 151337]
MSDVEIGRSLTGKRSFSLAFRLDFVRRWQDCTERGAKTRLLREFRLDESTVRPWLRAYDRGEYTTVNRPGFSGGRVLPAPAGTGRC